MSSFVDCDDFDFLDEEFERLKRRLYDRLKQGCFRLGYRPNKDLVLTKHLTRCQDDGDVSYGAELSEPSTLTDRTNSVRSDVFYVCDGQWRSGDWSTVGATTLTKRQNSLSTIRHRQVHVTPAKKLDPGFEERVTSVSEINTIQIFLPWFIPWILTALTILLSPKPSHSQVVKRRRDHNLRQVRSCHSKSTRRSTKNMGVKPVLHTRSSSTLLLARSLPSQNKEPAKDSPRDNRRISRQCAAVARLNRLPATGLPPRPRMIMTPPVSPRASPCECNDSEKPLCEATSSTPIPIENSPRAESSQPIKILSESPKKVIIEIERVGQLEGLLSKHFAQQTIDQREGRSTPSPVSKDKETKHGFMTPNIPETLVKSSGRSMEDTASETTGSQDKVLGNSFKSTQSRKAEAIRMIQAKKSRSRELANSKESQNSVGTVISDEQSRQGGLSREASGGDATQNSLSSSYGPDFYLEHNESSNGSSVFMLDSATSMGSETSTFGVELEGAPLSSQICELVRRNSSILGRDPLEMMYTNGSLGQWTAISEESSQDLRPDSGSDCSKSTATAERREDTKEKSVQSTIADGPPVTKLAIPKSISPFSDASIQMMTPPTPLRHQSSTASEDAEMNDPSANKTSVKESVPRPRSRVTRPPPPPPKKRTGASEESTEGKLKNKPAPPMRGNKEKKATSAAPPPPPGHKKKNGKNGSGYVRSSEVIKVFQDMRKISKKGFQPRVKSQKSTGSDTSNLASQGSGGEGLIKELEKNSSFFAQIQSDIETHGPAINKMIQDINTRKFETMSELNTFVKKIDDVLETFADETAVLKKFEWPQKYYVYREALALWCELKNRTDKCYKWTSGTRGISAELNRMKKTMELNLRRLDEVQRTLETDVKKFTRNGIPWDSTVLQKVNDGTMSLLEKYMQIVYDEVNRTQTKPKHREKNLNYLTETVNLTFKIHQFVGGLTESCTSLFEQIASFTRTLTDL